MAFGVGFVLVVGGLIFWISVAYRRAKREFDRHWSSVAAALGGEAIANYGPRRATVRYKVRGHAAELFAYEGKSSGGTSVSISLEGKSPGTFLVVEDLGTPELVKKIFGMQDLSTGDPSFDEEHIVKANPESLAYRIFAPQRRAAVITSVRRLKGGWAPRIEITRDAVVVAVSMSSLDERQILLMARTAEEFLGYVLSLEPADGICWGEAALRTGAPCPVCGTPMERRIVRCMKCRAPHHEDCWLYTRQCSTFACGELRYFELFDEEARRA